MLRQGIKPNFVTYSALTSACEKGQDLIKAVRLFEDVRRQGIKPTFVTYSTLTSTCEKGQDLIQALRLFENVLRQGITPTIVTYSALMSVCDKGVSEDPQGLIGSHGGWKRAVFELFSG